MGSSTGTFTYWSLLGLSPGSNTDQLKSAFRREAMRWHPDLNRGNKDAEERFKHAQTNAFAVFILFQLFNVLNCRSVDQSVFKLGLFKNTAITISFIISATFLFTMVQGAHYIVPIIGLEIGDFLSVVPLRTEDWLIVFATASSVLFVDELRKLFQRSSTDSTLNR